MADHTMIHPWELELLSVKPQSSASADPSSAGARDEAARSNQGRLAQELAKYAFGLDRSDGPAVRDLSLDAAKKIEGHSTGTIEELYESLLRLAVRLIKIYIQLNVTGPPLEDLCDVAILPGDRVGRPGSDVHVALSAALVVDGASTYPLASGIEFLLLAKSILKIDGAQSSLGTLRWWQVRADFLHQRLLTEQVDSLKVKISDGVEHCTSAWLQDPENWNASLRASLLVEIATIHTYYGEASKAQRALSNATQVRGFEYALTGHLGKRTQFQQEDLSQLVVIAKSQDITSDTNGTTAATSAPENIDLNDDTLLERISFVPNAARGRDEADRALQTLPAGLRTVEISKQPILDPLDSCILLAYAASVTNTSPNDGLTREETAPFATRVLEGGSSNWSVFTQALLLRSRIESYRARTVERGVLQLQALVDQIIADTAAPSIPGVTITDEAADEKVATFLPRAKRSESAPVEERLEYIFQLGASSRWELEKELAEKWIELGALRTALEIFERLQMWAEVALCYASTGDDQKARRLVRRQLFHHSDETASEFPPGPVTNPDQLIVPALVDAPRLWCILGDIEEKPEYYEQAWKVSQRTYSRAQRSLGRRYYAAKDFAKAKEAYTLALRSSPLRKETWFAVGCAHLETSDWEEAADAFTRCIQLDDTDAEAYSNLATALIRQEAKCADAITQDGKVGTIRLDISDGTEDEEQSPPSSETQSRNRRAALIALSRAATLKRDDWRIWENVMTIAALTRPINYQEIFNAMTRLIDLRSGVLGEKAIDIDMLEKLVRYAMIEDQEAQSDGKGSAAGSVEDTAGLPRLLGLLIEQKIVPLITTSARLWRVVVTWETHNRRFSAALDAQEKAWRSVSSDPGWETGTEGQWDEVVDSTGELVDLYQSIAEMTDGDALSTKQARLKGKSAIRGILGRAKGSWEDSGGWLRLSEKLEELKGP